MTYNFNTMHWWDRLDMLHQQYQAQGGIPATRYGLTLDQATAPWPDADPKLQQYLADSKKSHDEGGVFGNFTKALGEVVDFGDPVFKALAYPYHQLSTYVLSPMTHIMPVMFDRDWQNRINADSTWDAMFDGRSWNHVMDVAKKDSFGRGFWESAAMLDKGTSLEHFGEFGMNDAEMKKKTDTWQFTALSGTTDFLSVMFTDPLYVGGKFVKGAELLSTTKKIKPGALDTPEDFDKLMDSEPTSRFLNWTTGRPPEEIEKHPFLKRNPERGQIADLLSHATMQDKDLIFRLTVGDERALDELQRTSPAIAAEYLRMKGQVKFYQLTTLPSLTSTISSINKAKPLSAEEKAKLLAPKKAEVDQFGRDNRTQLKLGETEHNPFAQGPFVGRTEAERRAFNSYSTVYKPLGDDAQTRLLFGPSGELERTPEDLSKMLKEYRGFVDDARRSLRTLGLAERVKPLKGRAAVNRARLGSGLAPGEHIPPRFLSPWSETRLPGQQNLLGRDYLSGEISASRAEADAITGQIKAGPPTGIRGSGKAAARRLEEEKVPILERASDLRNAGKAVGESRKAGPQGESYQAWAQRQLADNDPARFPLWDHDVAAVTDYQAKMKGQLDLFDDFLTPEIRQQDSGAGFYQRIIDDAATIDKNGIRPGFFGSSTSLPKGGAYAGLAERSVKIGQFMDKAYQRRYNGQLQHYGFMSRPVYYMAKVSDGFSRGLVPTHYKMSDPEGWKKVDLWLRRVPHLSHAARKGWVRQLMGTTDDSAKLALMEKMEATVIRHMLHIHNVHDYETIQSITAVTLGSKKAYVGRMADTALERADEIAPRGSAEGSYSAVKSTQGLSPMGLTPDGVALVPGPLVAKQVANEYPLLPIDDLDRAFKRDGRWLYGEGSLALRDKTMEWSQLANRVWKTSVLARLGYPVRTISDELLLAGAALGSLTYYAGGLEGAARSARNVPTRAGNAVRRAENRRAMFKRQLPEVPLKRPPHQRGTEPVMAGKDTWARGFAGGPTGDINKALISADQKDLFSIHDNLLHELRKSTHWGELDPTKEVTHLAAWTHALNLQLGSDVMARRFLQGHSYDEVLTWLEKTPEGQAYARSMPHMAHQKEDWVKSVAYLVDSYTKGDPVLARAAMEGKVTPAMLRKIPVDERPPVHGGQIDYSRGVGGANGLFNTLSDGFYTVMSKMPADKLVRHPVADLIYQKRLRHLVAHAEAQGVKVAERPDRLYQMEESARRHTVKEIDRIFKDHLFSSPQTALRFVMPFFGAWRASIARWATMIGEDPSLVSRANQGWQGLHKPLQVVDENGLPVNEQTDENGKPRKSAKEIYGFNTKNSIVVRLPGPLARALGGIPFLPGGESYEDAPGRQIPLQSFNTVLQGDPWYNPGMGPFITIPLANILRDKPYAADIAQKTGVLPFGARANWMQQALPTYGQRAVTADEGFDNQQYTVTFINILRTEQMKINMGDRPDVPAGKLLEEVRRKTDDLSHLRVLESFLLPFSARPVYYAKEWETEHRSEPRAYWDPATGGTTWERDRIPGGLPKGYQFLAAKFRQYRQAAETPEQGEEAFLRDFPDAWLYTQSTSENKSKIPANFESWGRAKKVKYLASTTPDIFDSAAGVQNKDYKQFDATVYDAQMSGEWNPATGDHYRDVRDPSTLVSLAKSRQGWEEYSKFMDYVRGELQTRGLKTVNDPGARDLKTMKSDAIDYIGETNPDWKYAYGSPDLAKKARILEQARIVAADKSLATDPERTLELQSLGSYLAGRDYFAQQLMARGATRQGSLDIYAKRNRDLLNTWDDYREYLAEKDTRFSEIWLDRYFGNDYFQEMQ